ncbi:MAG TPA: glycosyltransferase family 39 protein [Xanthobacteraceae bacterium]|nr:glycosyltransferase family 39 protein [Xanthobacteraceae bacterium]
MTGALAAASNIALVGLFAGYAASHYRAGAAARIAVGFILIWTALGFAAYAVSVFSLLGNAWVYFVVSVLVSALQCLILLPALRAMPKDTLEREFAPTRGEWLLTRAALLGSAGAFVASVLIVIYFAPNNFDTLAYRFPRVMLYIGQGNLLHFAAFDPRLTLYPFGAVFLYLIPGLHALDGRVFVAVGLVCWLAGAAGVAALARALGTSRAAATLAAILYFTAPAVVVSATSTNDDMIAGVPAVCAALFAWRWWHSRSVVDAALAGAALGLSFGTKLHGVFYYPAFLVAGLLLLGTRAGRLGLADRLVHNWRGIALGVLLAGSMALPPLVINYLQAGKLFAAFAVTNSPFSVVAAGTNIAIGTLQLMFADVPNMILSLSAQSHKDLIATFNEFFRSHFLWWISDDLNYRFPNGYRFRGVADVDPGFGAWEQSVILGLLPWLLLVCVVVAYRQRRSSSAAWFVLWLALSLFLRHFAYNAHIKYAEAVGIYYAFAIAISAPAFAWLWDARLAMRRPLAIATVVAVFVAGTANFVIAGNSFLANHQRSLIYVVRAHFRPQVVSAIQDTVTPDLTQVLQRSQRTNFIYTRWELEMFTYMMKNMTARFSLTAEPRTDAGWLNIIAQATTDLQEMPVTHCSRPGEHRLALLGHLVGGGPIVFGSGALPADIDPRRTGYLMFRPYLYWDSTTTNATAFSVPIIYGASSGERLRFRVTQIMPNGESAVIATGATLGELAGKRHALVQPAGAGRVNIELGEPGECDSTGFPISRGTLLDPANNGYAIVDKTTVPSLLEQFKRFAPASP